MVVQRRTERYFLELPVSALPRTPCFRRRRRSFSSPSSLFLCAAVVNRNRSVPSVLTALACCGVCKAMRFRNALVKNAPPERFCLRSERLRAPLLAHSPSSLFLCAAVVNRNRSVPSVLTALACCGVCKAMRFRNALVKNAPPERFCLRSERLRAPLLAHSPSSLFLCAAVVNRKRTPEWVSVFYGAPEETRTPDLLIRRRKVAV